MFLKWLCLFGTSFFISFSEQNSDLNDVSLSIDPFLIDDVIHLNYVVDDYHVQDYYGFLLPNNVVAGPFDSDKFYMSMRDCSSGFEEGLAPVKKDGFWGYIDKSGHQVIDFKYSYADFFLNDLAMVKFGEDWIIIDKNDDMITLCDFDDYITRFGSFHLVCRDNMYGFIDNNGNDLCDFVYSGISDYRDVTRLNDSYIIPMIKNQFSGYVSVSSDGVKELTPFIYTKLWDQNYFVRGDYSNGEFINLTRGFFDENLNEKFVYSQDEYSEVSYGFYDSKLAYHFVNSDGFHGFMDENFNIVVDPIYEYIDIENDQFAIISKNELYGVMDSNGNIVVPLQEHTLTHIKSCDDDLWVTGKQFEDFTKLGFAKLEKNLKWSSFYDYLSLKSDFIVVGDFPVDSNNVDNSNNVYGVMDFEENIVIPIEYESLCYDYYSDWFFVNKNSDWFMMDDSKDQILKIDENYKSLDVISLNYTDNLGYEHDYDDYILVRSQDNLFGLLNLNGDLVLPVVFSDLNYYFGDKLFLKFFDYDFLISKDSLVNFDKYNN